MITPAVLIRKKCVIGFAVQIQNVEQIYFSKKMSLVMLLLMDYLKREEIFLLCIQRVFDTDTDTDGTNEAVKVICKTYMSDKIWYCILSNIII